MKIQFNLNFSNNKKIIFSLAFLLLSACSPASFKTETQSSSTQPPSNSVNNTAQTNPEVSETSTSSKTCSLSSNSPVKMGEAVKFTFTTNFKIPQDAKLIWRGKSFGVDLKNSDDGAIWLARVITYSSPMQAGIHQRQVIVTDSSGNSICQSNVLKVEFSGEIPADKSCTNIGGSLTGDDKEDCSIEEWTLYRAMLARHLTNVPSPIGGALGMMNPATANCDSIGESVIIENNTVTKICLVSKYKIWNLGF